MFKLLAQKEPSTLKVRSHQAFLEEYDKNDDQNTTNDLP